MTRTCFLLLFFAGCAAPTPRSRNLHDGRPVRAAPVFVAPGYTPAGAGLPEYMPTAEAPAVERSPHRRLLPETPSSRREPGLWAGDEPRAMTGRDPFPVVIGGVHIPAPDGGKSTAPMRVCGMMVSQHLAQTDPDYIYDFVLPLGKRKQDCLSTMLYELCIARRMRLREGKQDYQLHAAAHEAALSTKDAKCKGLSLRDDSPLTEVFNHLAQGIYFETANWKEVKLDGSETE